MIYVIIMAIAVALTYNVKFTDKKKEKISKVFLFLSFLITYFFSAVRYDIGTDYSYIYVPYFYGIGNDTMQFPEIGFNVINKIIYILTGDYKVLFAITSLIFIGLIYKGIKDNSINITISVLMIFIGQSYFYSMNMIRQAIAIAFIFYGFKYIKEKKLVKYIIICAIAFTMHNTAILMIPVYFLSELNLSRKMKIGIIILCFFTKEIVGQIFQSLLINTKYYMYYDSMYNTGTITTTLLLTNIVIFALNLYYDSKEDKEYKILSNINFIGVCLIIMGAQIPLLDRLIRYFTIFQILLIPKLFEKEKNAKVRIIIEFLLLGLLFAGMYYQIIMLGGEEVYPYKWIFNIEN